MFACFFLNISRMSRCKETAQGMDSSLSFFFQKAVYNSGVVEHVIQGSLTTVMGPRIDS